MDFDREFAKNTEDITGVNVKLVACRGCESLHTNTGSFCSDCETEMHPPYGSTENLKARANME